MRLLIAAVGRLKQGPERELFAHYLDRAAALGRKLGFNHFAASELAESKLASTRTRIAAEADALLAKVPAAYKVIALDQTGDQLSSDTFARSLAKFRGGGAPGLAFAIGGADGLGPVVLAKAELVLSLGSLTLPHAFARIVLAEQIYRAMTILSGHPYHRA